MIEGIYRTLPELPENQAVWVDNRGHQIPGRISCSASTPHSYLIKTPSGELRRNRVHLLTRSDAPHSETADSDASIPQVIGGLLPTHRQVHLFNPRIVCGTKVKVSGPE